MPIYMNFPGIKGEVTGKYAGWIELESCQIGNRSRPIATNAGLGRGDSHSPGVSDVVITKHRDSASTALFRASIQGEPKKVTIDFVKSSGFPPYLSMELDNTLISGYSVSGRGSSGIQEIETLTLDFNKIAYSSKPTSTAVGVRDKVLWDLAVSKGG